MKYSLLLLLLTLAIVQAQENDISLHAKMIEKLSWDVLHKKQIMIYDPSFGSSYATYLEYVAMVNSCAECDIAILNSINQTNGCKNKIIYNLLNVIPDAIGALYWQKGRLNLIFIRSRLAEKGVRLSSEYTKLIDDQVY